MPRATRHYIKDDLLKKAQKLTGISNKEELVNYALKRLLEQKEIERVFELRGKVKWDGSLDEMRRDRHLWNLTGSD